MAPKLALQPLEAMPTGSGSFLKEIERELIFKTLKENKGNQRRTATILGIPKSTLHDKIKTFGIDLSLL